MRYGELYHKQGRVLLNLVSIQLNKELVEIISEEDASDKGASLFLYALRQAFL